MSTVTLTDAEQIMDRCDELAQISSLPDGIQRTYLTPEHKRHNAVVERWMIEAGMTTWQDASGNQCGRLEGATPGLPALLLGSHLDTVTDAGRYDGILGVLMAVTTVARIAPRASELPFALEVVAFADEEGTRFGTALLGSRALAGTWDDEFWHLEDKQGVSLRDAFVEFGLDPDKVGEAARRREDLVGYLEAHIEQGPYLEDANRSLAVVSAIAGARRFALTLTGKAGHAGMPYPRRRDALVGASEIVVSIEKLAREAGCLATVGKFQAYPGGVNIVPGEVQFSLDLRGEYDRDRDQVLAKIQERIEEVCRTRRLSIHIEETHNAPAVAASRPLARAITAGIQSTGDKTPMEFYSKAGHDAMAVAAVTPIAMLFIRCKKGISHHPDEAVTTADVAVALDAFEKAVLTVAADHGDKG